MKKLCLVSYIPRQGSGQGKASCPGVEHNIKAHRRQAALMGILLGLGSGEL